MNLLTVNNADSMAIWFQEAGSQLFTSLPSYPKRKRRPPPILANAPFGPLLEPRVKLVTILRKHLRKAILEEQVTIAAAASTCDDGGWRCRPSLWLRFESR